MSSKRTPKRDVDISEIRKYTLQDVSTLDVALQTTISSIFLRQRNMLIKNIPDREAWLAIERFNLESDEIGLEKAKSDIELHYDFLTQKEVELDSAKRNLERELELLKKVQDSVAKARRKVKRAEEILEATKNYHKELEQVVDEEKKSISERTEHLTQMESIVLIHKSATLKQVSEVQYGYIVVNSTDMQFLSFVKPDEQFNNENAEKFVEWLPTDFWNKYSKEDADSIVDFCNMVINFQLNADGGKMVVPVYANKDINEILCKNGV